MTHRRGLTLIELTVALAVVVVMFTAVVYGVGALTGARAKEAATELAGTIRYLYDTASLTGRTCRLVFELPGEKDDDGQVRYHAECAKGALTTSARRDEELREVRAARDRPGRQRDEARFRRLDSEGSQPTLEELAAREKNRVEEQARYEEFSSEDIVEKELPAAVRLEVWTVKQRDPVKHGPAFLYFFPQGYTERAQVYLRQGSNTWTLAVSPLTGRTVIHNQELKVPRT